MDFVFLSLIAGLPSPLESVGTIGRSQSPRGPLMNVDECTVCWYLASFVEKEAGDQLGGSWLWGSK